jgi:hypothetical protein
MSWRPERKSPAGSTPGSEISRVRGQFQTETYSEQAENARPSCADCALLQPYENGGGECRALPPRIMDDSFMREGQWPRVSAWDWCGAFVRRAGA